MVALLITCSSKCLYGLEIRQSTDASIFDNLKGCALISSDVGMVSGPHFESSLGSDGLNKCVMSAFAFSFVMKNWKWTKMHRSLNRNPDTWSWQEKGPVQN